MEDVPTQTTPPLSPPNGHSVTNGELYKALYTMDQRLAERDTALIAMATGIRTDLSAHTRDGHPFTQNAEIIKEEIKLDAKKLGVVSILLGIVGTVTTFIVAVIRGKLDLF